MNLTTVRRIATAAATAALTVSVAACGGITHGTITGKQYVPAHQYVEMEPIYGSHCSGYGKNFSCRTVITAWIPETMTDPECYRLDLRAGKKTGHVCVAASDYATAHIGGTW